MAPVGWNAMGTNVAVIYAILVMAYLERKLYTRVNEMYRADYAEYIIKNWRRFIDDCFLIWNNQYNLGEFFDMLNNLDDNIKFTMENHTDKLPFLDIMVMKSEDGTISTDIFYKTTNTHLYLDLRSCHKHHVKINVPFNLSRKLCLVVSDKDRLDHRLKELKGFLLACHYPAKVIDEAISSVKDRTQHQRPPRNEDVFPLVITHNPHHSLDFGYITSLMDNVESTRLQRASRNKAILANRQPANLKNLLTKAEFTSTEIKGCTSCTRSNCQLCSKGYVRNVDKLFSSTGPELFKLNTHFHCKSFTCLYYLTCPVCTKNYVGKTANFRERMNNHKTDIRISEPSTIYADKHFNECITKKFGFLKEPLFYITPFNVKSRYSTARLLMLRMIAKEID